VGTTLSHIWFAADRFVNNTCQQRWLARRPADTGNPFRTSAFPIKPRVSAVSNYRMQQNRRMQELREARRSAASKVATIR
jgi:hypothetical protein